MDIASGISTTLGTSDRGEADKDGGLLPGGVQERGVGKVAPVGVAGESAVGARSTSMDGSFGDLVPRQRRECHVIGGYYKALTRSWSKC